MKKNLSKLIASVVMGALIVMPVQAAPDTESFQNEIDSAQNEVDSLQTQLRSVLNRIYTLESQMITTGEKIIQAEADLQSAEELEQRQYEDMKLRIKYIYEEGSNNTLEKLFEAGSFSKLLNQAEYIQSIHSYDREMLNEYAETKEKVAELKSTLETEMADLESMQKEFSDQQASLNTTIAHKKTEVSDLDDQLQTAVQATAEDIQTAENTAAQNQAEDTEEQNQTEDIQVAAAEDDDTDNGNVSDSTDNPADDTEDTENTVNDQQQDSEPTDAVITITAEEDETTIDDTAEKAAEDNTNNNNTSSDDDSDDVANSVNSSANSDDGSSTANNAGSSQNSTDNNNTDSNSAADNSKNDTTRNTGSDTVSSSDTTTAQKIVSAAYTQLGVEYVWGGTIPYVGLDCSGLTQYAHKQAGISIARTSAVQGAGGKAVTTPQAGDLVCYAGHVGIYIGNGQMIHAPHTGSVVKVQSVYGSPWYRRYW